MIVDPDLLNMGAAFSQSAGDIARRGGAKLSQTAIPSHIFGDLDAARSFHRHLSKAHETHVNTLEGVRSDLDSLADRAVVAATAFRKDDDAGASLIERAANLL